MVCGVLMCISFACWVVGWMGAAKEATVAHQISWSGLAVSGLVVMQGAISVWMGRGFRAVAVRRRALLGEFRITEALRRNVISDRAECELLEAAFVAVAGLTRFHRPGCLLVVGKEAAIARTMAEHEAAGLRACEMCRP
jgi:hypothetical protein